MGPGGQGPPGPPGPALWADTGPDWQWQGWRCRRRWPYRELTGSSVLNSKDSIAVENVNQILDFGLQSIKAVTKARWT